jgi:hypothetical protein
MAAYLSQAGLEVLNDVVLNQVLVRTASLQTRSPLEPDLDERLGSR